MIHKAVVDPFDLAGDAFQLESQAFGNRAATRVFRGALDGDAVQLPDIETMFNQRAATGGHDAFSLVAGVQPITQRRPTVRPIHIQMIDYAAEPALISDRRIKPAIIRILLLPIDDCALDCGGRTNGVHPRMPLPDVLSIGLNEFE